MRTLSYRRQLILTYHLRRKNAISFSNADGLTHIPLLTHNPVEKTVAVCGGGNFFGKAVNIKQIMTAKCIKQCDIVHSLYESTEAK